MRTPLILAAAMSVACVGLIFSSNLVSSTRMDDGFVFISGGIVDGACLNNDNGCQKVVEDFYLAKFETTFSEWEQCHQEGFCKAIPEDAGWGRGQRPVVNIGIPDIYQEYIPWKNSQSEQYAYSLPQIHHYEYLLEIASEPTCETARIGYPFDCMGTNSTVEVGSYDSDVLGVHDITGNVREWTFSRVGELNDLGATEYYINDLSFASNPSLASSSYREIGTSYLGNKSADLGFRLVRLKRSSGGNI